MRIIAAIAYVVMLVCLGIMPGYAEKRVALVIGNDRYVNLPADQQLRKAVNDARAVGDALKRLDFEVIRGENLARQALVDKFDELTGRLSPGDTAFFFFAGHGVTIAGGNYILPADVPNVAVGQDMRLARASLGESDIVSDLQGRGVRVAVVVLDACRNNPFKQPGVRGVGAERGLGRIEPVRGVFTLYSAGIGQTALDRLNDTDPDPNSVFTRIFVPALTKPGLGLGDLAFEVREEVARLAASVQHDQRPAYYDETIGGRVYLAGLPSEAKPAEPPKLPAAQASPSTTEAERVWFGGVKDTTSITVLDDFVRRYGDTIFGTMARERLDELKKKELALPVRPATPPTPVQPTAVALAEPTVESGTDTSSTGQFTISKKMEAFGSPIGDRLIMRMGQCEQACAKLATCRVFTYNKSVQSCFLYSKVDLRPSEFFDSGVRGTVLNSPTTEATMATGGQFKISTNMEAFGSPIGERLVMLSIGQCEQTCARSATCRVFTYNKSAQSCFLYSKIDLHPSAFFDSGVRR